MPSLASHSRVIVVRILVIVVLASRLKLSRLPDSELPPKTKSGGTPKTPQIAFCSCKWRSTDGALTSFRTTPALTPAASSFDPAACTIPTTPPSPIRSLMSLDCSAAYPTATTRAGATFDSSANCLSSWLSNWPVPVESIAGLPNHGVRESTRSLKLRIDSPLRCIVTVWLGPFNITE